MQKRFLNAIAKVVWVGFLVSGVAWFGYSRHQSSLERQPTRVPVPREQFDLANESGPLFPSLGNHQDTVVVFASFDCAWCAQLWAIIDTGTLWSSAPRPAIRFRHLSHPADSVGTALTRLAECSVSEGKFRDVARRLYATPSDQWPSVTSLAEGFGLSERTLECAHAVEAQAALNNNASVAASLGITGTPTIYGSTFRMTGVGTQENLVALISSPEVK